MKRILIFSLAYYPHVGGAEVSIKEITDRITDVEFHMVTLRFDSGHAQEEKVGNVFVHRVGGGASYLSKILFIPRAAFLARALHRRHRFDAFWAVMSYMLFPIVLARCIGLRDSYILTLQEGDPWEYMFLRWFILPLRPLLSYGFRHTATVTAISTYLATWAREMGYGGTVEIIPNGVDIARFSGSSVAHEGVVLITTSRLVHKNAVDDVIRALVFLPSHIRFQILGTGPDETMLKVISEKENVAGRVEFLGHIDHRDMPGYLHAANIFVRPSRTEGQGASFMEAMGAGLPVIATQEGGIADFLFDAKRNPDKPTTGWAVDKDAPQQIAEAVKNILANPPQVEKVKENALMLVREKYDWDLIAKQMRSVFGLACGIVDA